jgi:hypothetical protein
MPLDELFDVGLGESEYLDADVGRKRVEVWKRGATEAPVARPPDFAAVREKVDYGQQRLMYLGVE